jgi:hypothetical protein
MPLSLYPRYPLDRRLAGPQSRSGRHGEEKILDPTETQTPTPQSSSLQPVAIMSAQPSLSWGEGKSYKATVLSFHFLKINLLHTHARTYELNRNVTFSLKWTYCLLECDTTQSGRLLPMFQRNILSLEHS